LEATYKDPTGCAARNVHGITVDQVQQMAEQWEEAPSLYMQLDIKVLMSFFFFPTLTSLFDKDAKLMPSCTIWH
jgi:hypothetical protein